MPTDRNFTNLTVNRERCERSRKIFETLGIDQTFNTWVLDLIESGIEKIKFVKANLSDYVFAELDGEGFACIDKSKDEIFRIHFEEEHLICSKHGEENCNHKLFATMHPNFKGGLSVN